MLYKKANVVTDKAARDAWRMEGDHGDRCQICHRPLARAGWLGLPTHHIIHGSNGRSDEPCNFLKVCGRCHAMIHDGCYRDEQTKELLPTITLGMVLLVKSQTPSWDPDRLEVLYHRRLPDLERLAEYYMNERERYQ